MSASKQRTFGQFWALWLPCIAIATGFGYYFKEPLFSFAIIMMGLAITLVFFACSKDDEGKDIRANVELIKLYAKLAYLIISIVGILVLIYMIGEFILKPFF